MTVEGRDLWQRIVETLRLQILTGELEKDARLGEVKLARQFGVSRGPVRDALRVLETEGLVTRHQRFGSYVTSFGANDVEEVYALRGALEGLAARESITRNWTALRFGLAQALEEMTDALDRGELAEVLQADLRFHDRFYEFAENKRLLTAWQGLRHPVAALVAASQANWDDADALHTPILVAVEERDVEKCAVAIQHHMAVARIRVLGD